MLHFLLLCVESLFACLIQNHCYSLRTTQTVSLLLVCLLCLFNSFASQFNFVLNQSESGCGSPCTERSHSPTAKPPVAFLESIEAVHHVTAVPPMLSTAPVLPTCPSSAFPPSRPGTWHSKFSLKGRQSPSSTSQPVPITHGSNTLGPATSTGGSLRRTHSPCTKTQSYSLGTRSDKHHVSSTRLTRTGSSPAQSHADVSSQKLDLTSTLNSVPSSACRPTTTAGDSVTHELSAPNAANAFPVSSPIATRSVSTHRRTSSEVEEPATSFGSAGAQADCLLPTPQYKFMVSAEGLHLLVSRLI
jgi:hypothetical protein